VAKNFLKQDVMQYRCTQQQNCTNNSGFRAAKIIPSRKIRILFKHATARRSKHTFASSRLPMFAPFNVPQFMASFVPLGVVRVAIALIDIRHGIIPDGLNLVIAGLGFVKAAVAGGLGAGAETIVGAIAVGAILCLLRRLYFAWRKIDGLGLGDVKLLAASTPWIGIAGIPMLLLIASLAALSAAGR